MFFNYDKMGYQKKDVPMENLNITFVENDIQLSDRSKSDIRHILSCHPEIEEGEIFTVTREKKSYYVGLESASRSTRQVRVLEGKLRLHNCPRGCGYISCKRHSVF